ncbi:MAG: UbiA family prenyltransferase [archaeon]
MLKPYLDLIRVGNCLIAAFGVLIGYLVAMHSFVFNLQILLAMISAFLICGAGQSINDYFDLEVDRKKKIKKPILEFNLNPKTVFMFSIALFVLGSVIAFFTNTITFAIAVAFSILLIVYSAFFSKIKYLGNWIVALGTSFTLIYGASLVGNYSVVLWFALLALFANVYRELVKDMEDLDADKGIKKTMPMLVGIKNTKYLSVFILLLAFVFSYVPFLQNLTNFYYLLAVTFANLIFIYSILQMGNNNFKKAQQLSKIAMLFGLISFLVSII